MASLSDILSFDGSAQLQKCFTMRKEGDGSKLACLPPLYSFSPSPMGNNSYRLVEFPNKGFIYNIDTDLITPYQAGNGYSLSRCWADDEDNNFEIAITDSFLTGTLDGRQFQILPDANEKNSIIGYLWLFINKGYLYIIGNLEIVKVSLPHLYSFINEKTPDSQRGLISINLSEISFLEKIKIDVEIQANEFNAACAEIIENDLVVVFYNNEFTGVHLSKIMVCTDSLHDIITHYIPFFKFTSMRLIYRSIKEPEAMSFYLSLMGILKNRSVIDGIKFGSKHILIAADNKLVMEDGTIYNFDPDSVNCVLQEVLPLSPVLQYSNIFSDDKDRRINGLISMLEDNFTPSEVNFFGKNYQQELLEIIDNNLDLDFLKDYHFDTYVNNIISLLKLNPEFKSIARSFLNDKDEVKLIGICCFKGGVRGKDNILPEYISAGVNIYNSEYSSSVVFDSDEETPGAELLDILKNSIEKFSTEKGKDLYLLNNSIHSSIIRMIINAAGSWNNYYSGIIIRHVFNTVPEDFYEQIIEVIKNYRLNDLEDIIRTFLTSSNPAHVAFAIDAMESINYVRLEEHLPKLLFHAEDRVCSNAIDSLNRQGTIKTLEILFYSAFCSYFEMRGKYSFNVTENDAISGILQRTIEMENDIDLDELKNNSKLKDKLNYLSDYMIPLIVLMLQHYLDEYKDNPEKDKMLGNFSDETGFFALCIPGLGKIINESSIRRLAGNKTREKEVIKILKWIMTNIQSDFSKYLLALTLAFRRDFLNLSNPSPAGKVISLYLQEILEKAYHNESNELRRQFSALALLELGADKKWEEIVLSYQKSDVWRELPRINNIARGITDYLPLINKLPDLVREMKEFSDLSDGSSQYKNDKEKFLSDIFMYVMRLGLETIVNSEKGEAPGFFSELMKLNDQEMELQQLFQQYQKRWERSHNK